MADEIDFLGHRVNRHGVFPLPEKVQTVRSFATPATVKALQEYLGMVNFYHRFVPSASAVMQPLYKPVDKKTKKIVWIAEMEEGFVQSKEALANATMMVHPRHNEPTTYS